jgi:hypothetical protein
MLTQGKREGVSCLRVEVQFCLLLLFVLLFQLSYFLSCAQVSLSEQILDEEFGIVDIAKVFFQGFQVYFRLLMDKGEIEGLPFCLFGDCLHEVLGGLLEEHGVVAFPGDVDLDVVDCGGDPAV